MYIPTKTGIDMTSNDWQVLHAYLKGIALQAKVPGGDYSNLSFRFKVQDDKIVHVEVAGEGSIKPNHSKTGQP